MNKFNVELQVEDRFDDIADQEAEVREERSESEWQRNTFSELFQEEE